MPRPSDHRSQVRNQNDPDETNDPRPRDHGGFDMHLWTSLNQIFERLGKLDQKLDQLGTEQGKLKESVEKHDRIIMRATFTIAGAMIVIAALWFLYENVLKDRITIS
jgi:ABC-type Zn2+ transport system substrate-binding protein/surface adhesin